MTVTTTPTGIVTVTMSVGTARALSALIDAAGYRLDLGVEAISGQIRTTLDGIFTNPDALRNFNAKEN